MKEDLDDWIGDDGSDIDGLLRLLGCALFIIVALIVALVWSLMR